MSENERQPKLFGQTETGGWVKQPDKIETYAEIGDKQTPRRELKEEGVELSEKANKKSILDMIPDAPEDTTWGGKSSRKFDD